ncbi:MAG: hypothetical protein ACK44D_00110 [Bacteroidia bacterium]
MIDLTHANNQIQLVTTFKELVATPFVGNINAMYWERKLLGDFAEIVEKIELLENITAIEPDELLALQLSEQGNIARETILADWDLLKTHGAQPTLNIIKYYDRDDAHPLIPTDVYSFHVDRSPVPTDTFLCTYLGEASEILPSAQAIPKTQIPEIRNQLRNEFDGTDEAFENYLIEAFFDLHYQPKPNANTISLGIGHLWRLAVDYPESKVPACVHRAPQEKNGEYRLLLIC